MLEWLKRHAWKACVRQKRIRGSNPRLSAKKDEACAKLLGRKGKALFVQNTCGSDNLSARAGAKKSLISKTNSSND